jgi:hypothetical protein
MGEGQRGFMGACRNPFLIIYLLAEILHGHRQLKANDAGWSSIGRGETCHLPVLQEGVVGLQEDLPQWAIYRPTWMKEENEVAFGKFVEQSR